MQSLEDLEQVSGWKVSDIQLVHVPDPREDVHKLQIFDADEVMQTRQIGDEVPSRFEAEDFERMKSSAMFSSLSIPAVDANSTCLPLKGRLRRTGPVVRLAATMTTMPSSSSIFNNCSASGRLLIRYVSDRKSLEIKSLEMVDLTGASWNRLTVWLNSLDQLRQSDPFDAGTSSGNSR
ncbi:MAG: hypothetical protein DMG03_10795 [Acidobacteria bacterium]|nr:MAG: hypothetical protein DMG03_10795 [Acidobacteriota bacterium]